jgi:uncharacterized Zn finger protein
MTWQSDVLKAIEDSDSGFAYLGTGRVYAIPSKSNEREWHTVVVFETDGEGELRSCTCPAFRYRAACSHVEAVP